MVVPEIGKAARTYAGRGTKMGQRAQTTGGPIGRFEGGLLNVKGPLARGKVEVGRSKKRRGQSISHQRIPPWDVKG